MQNVIIEIQINSHGRTSTISKSTKQIKESDVVIVEGTAQYRTGHYMTIALNYLKPVWCYIKTITVFGR
jgi:hypothetical protein